MLITWKSERPINSTGFRWSNYFKTWLYPLYSNNIYNYHMDETKHPSRQSNKRKDFSQLAGERRNNGERQYHYKSKANTKAFKIPGIVNYLATCSEIMEDAHQWRQAMLWQKVSLCSTHGITLLSSFAEYFHIYIYAWGKQMGFNSKLFFAFTLVTNKILTSSHYTNCKL